MTAVKPIGEIGGSSPPASHRPCARSLRPDFVGEYRGFTIIELLVVVAIIGILVAILLPAINAIRENARRTVCMSQMRQVGLAVIAHQQTRGRFPLATDSPAYLITATPGSTDTLDEAGYSWIVKVLPYMEETQAEADVLANSATHSLPSFDAGIMLESGIHVSELKLPLLLCPSFSGGSEIAATAEGEYGELGPALSNCMAIVGTHIDETGLDPNCPRGICENGILVSAQENGGRGLSDRQITDGLSNTLLLCESRERAYASWYDGQTAVVLAVPDPMEVHSLPNVASSGRSYTAQLHALNFGPSSISDDGNGPVYMAAALVHPGGGTENGNGGGSEGGAGNPNGGGQGSGNGGSGGNGGGNGNGQGPSGDGNQGNGVGNTGPGNQGNDGTMGNAGGIPRPYKSERWWGPSSEHAGGVVIHVFADGRVLALHESIDATLYLQLVTRNGAESSRLDY